jgi:hypothetical protein
MREKMDQFLSVRRGAELRTMMGKSLFRLREQRRDMHLVQLGLAWVSRKRVAKTALGLPVSP